MKRRCFLQSSSLSLVASQLALNVLSDDVEIGKKLSLFDSKTLNGWKAIPRLAVPQSPMFAKIPASELKAAVVAWHQAKPEQRARLEHTGRWEVVDGAIIGGHEPPESLQGAYLITEQKFADFELELEARPDWPVDTGIMIRSHELGSVGFQIQLDYRPKGGVGGVFGNGIGSFLAAPFTLDGDKLPNFQVTNLRQGERESNFKAPTIDYAASFSDFAKVWHENDWNHFRIRCVGNLPTITTWVNGLKVFELDTSKIDTPGFNAAQVIERLGSAGHIAFEVHDVNPNNPLGQDRWAPGAVCRWRNINMTELS
jgi:hypothetical protein